MANNAEDQTLANTSLLDLPTELIQHILFFLEPLDLAAAAKTCRRLYDTSFDDRIWQPIVNSHLPNPISTPDPAKSFRDLYIAHHPHWFLTERRIWFSDSAPSGKLIVARYDESRGSITAHSVVARRGHHYLTFWEKNRNVIIHSFDPHVSLDPHQPVLKLDLDCCEIDHSPNINGNVSQSIYSREFLMDTFQEKGLHSSLTLCRALPDAAITAQTQLWPPTRIPASARARNDSSSRFNSTGHRPSKLSEVSHNNFRLRRFLHYGNRSSITNRLSSNSGSSLAAAFGLGRPYFTARFGSSDYGMNMQLPEDITTFASLPEWCYHPTPQKPWQGLYCADYSGHGCEFILITQPDQGTEKPLPPGMELLHDWFNRGRRGSSSSTASSSSAIEEQTGSNAAGYHAEHTPGRPEIPSEHPLSDSNYAPTGRIEAIKLTGDPNVPRGEYTFLAPDIGDGGFIRVADEQVFRGARIVRSAGHIAGRGFVEDEYTPSQLIMISHDRLAQYWEAFGHISYYQRVDLEKLMTL